MQRSCLVGLILIAALLMAVSFALQRYLIRPRLAAQVAPTTVPTVPEPTPQAVEAVIETAVPTPEAAPAPVLPSSPVFEKRIQGLLLEEVHPLDGIGMQVRGLAAADGALYATAFDPQNRAVWLHQLDGATRALVRSLPLYDQGPGEPCGLQVNEQMLWTCLSTDDSALILGIDRGAWSVVSRTPFTGTLSVVAQTDDGSLVGMDRQGQRRYRWGADGTLVHGGANSAGFVYRDCETIRGSLVCVGVDDLGGVMDVLDPIHLTLLARYRAMTRTAWDAWVAGNSLAFDGERFLLVPAGGESPTLWSYRLDGVSLATLVPSIYPAR